MKIVPAPGCPSRCGAPLSWGREPLFPPNRPSETILGGHPPDPPALRLPRLRSGRLGQAPALHPPHSSFRRKRTAGAMTRYLQDSFSCSGAYKWYYPERGRDCNGKKPFAWRCSVKFGIFYEISVPRPWDRGSERTVYERALEQVRLADELGFDQVWAVEHHFLEEYSPAPRRRSSSQPARCRRRASGSATASSSAFRKSTIRCASRSGPPRWTSSPAAGSRWGPGGPRHGRSW